MKAFALVLAAAVTCFGVSAAPALGMSKEQARKECAALYGRSGYRNRDRTGMTVEACVREKMGGK